MAEVIVPIAAPKNSDVVALIAQRMDEANADMMAYLAKQLWLPHAPWYWRVIDRILEFAHRAFCRLGQHDWFTSVWWNYDDDGEDDGHDAIVTQCRWCQRILYRQEIPSMDGERIRANG